MKKHERKIKVNILNKGRLPLNLTGPLYGIYLTKENYELLKSMGYLVERVDSIVEVNDNVISSVEGVKDIPRTFETKKTPIEETKEEETKIEEDVSEEVKEEESNVEEETPDVEEEATDDESTEEETESEEETPAPRRKKKRRRSTSTEE